VIGSHRDGPQHFHLRVVRHIFHRPLPPSLPAGTAIIKHDQDGIVFRLKDAIHQLLTGKGSRISRRRGNGAPSHLPSHHLHRLTATLAPIGYQAPFPLHTLPPRHSTKAFPLKKESIEAANPPLFQKPWPSTDAGWRVESSTASPKWAKH